MHLLAVVALLLLGEASAYTVRCARPVARSTRRVKTITAQATADEEEPMAIRAPMRMLGPYPVLSLRFPGIATPAQFKEQQKLTGETGVALDFVVDTAANVNTINAKLTAMSKATWSARADHAADWPRLAEAWGSLGRALALKAASSAPAGRSMSQLVCDIGGASRSYTRSSSCCAANQSSGWRATCTASLPQSRL